MSLRRDHHVVTLTIANGEALSDAIDLTAFAGGIVLMPAAWTTASLGFYVCGTSGGTFLPLYDDDGTLVQIDSPAASRAYSIPEGVYAAHYVKLWSQNGSGTGTNQGAARSIGVMVKG